MAGLVAASPPAILGDPAWFTDIGATDHITGDLDCLMVREKYPEEIASTQLTGQVCT